VKQRITARFAARRYMAAVLAWLTVSALLLAAVDRPPTWMILIMMALGLLVFDMPEEEEES
jgi:uncharacterized membrane protein